MLLRRFGTFLRILSALLIASQPLWAQGPAVVYEAYTFRQDFESGENTGWASYPPAQDTAYDPGLYPTSETHPAGSQYALMRERRQGFVGPLDIGVIRKVRLRVTEQSTLRFDFNLKDYGGASSFEAVIAAADGKQYHYAVPAWQSGQWQTVTAPLSRFVAQGQALPSGAEVQAIYFKATIPESDPDVVYRLAVDNVELTGQRKADFQILQPETAYLEHWHRWVSVRHYHRGENVLIQVTPPKAAGRLKEAWASLYAPNGARVVKKRRLQRVDTGSPVGRWGTSGLYRIRSNDPFGIWRVEVGGKDRRGRSISTSMTFWVTPEPGRLGHPRLFFSANDVPRYQALAAGAGKQLWQKLVDKAAKLRQELNLDRIRGAQIGAMDRRFLLPTLRGYFDIISPLTDFLGTNSIVYAITGDDTVGNALKDAVLAAAQMEQWTPPWFVTRGQPTYYPIGRLAYQVAFAYDVLYNRLSQEERQVIRDGLRRLIIQPAYQEYVVDNRVPFSTSNWICHVTGGALLAATSIYGDDPNQGDLEPYLSGLLAKMTTVISSTLGPAGSWGEGYSYERFAFESLTPALAALERNFDIRVFDRTPLANALYLPLYAYSAPELLDFGDTSDHLYSSGPFAWLAWRAANPYWKWFNEQAGRNDVQSFIWFAPELSAKTPADLPTSRYFPKVGSAVFRTGWSPDDILFHFRAGPFVNHQHFDQGSFLLHAFGEALVTEGGKSHYYDDPYYQTYFIQAAGHNTVLINGNPGSQRSGDLRSDAVALDSSAAITDHLTTPFLDMVSARLERLYRGKLSRFERTVLFLKPDYFVIFDRLRSTGEPLTYDWLLHGPRYDGLRVNTAYAEIAGKRASLLVKVVAPSDAQVERKEAPIPIAEVLHPESPGLRVPGYFQVSNPTPRVGEEFLVVLYPERRPATDGTAERQMQRLAQRVVRIEAEGFVGVEVTRGEAVDRIYFRSQDGKRILQDADLTADAAALAVTREQGALRRVFLRSGTFVQVSGEKLLATDRPLTATALLTQGQARWQFNSPEATSVSLTLPAAPGSVRMDGKPVRRVNFSKSEGRLRLYLPAGQHSLELAY